MITEIGAVKVRGGEVLGEFQTPGQPAHRDPAVHRGAHRHHQLHGRPRRRRSSRRCPPSWSSPRAASWWRTTRRSTSASSSTSPPSSNGRGRPSTSSTPPSWPVGWSPATTRRTASSPRWPWLFGAATTPNHRALSDARATVDVLHGLMERLGVLGVHTLEELQTFSAKVSAAQRRKRHLAESLPHAPGVYLFRDERDRVLYVGTSRDLRTRVRSYFTASETRSRIGEMVALAARVSAIECSTPLEASVRELRLIAAPQAALQPPQPVPREGALDQAHRRALAPALPGAPGARRRAGPGAGADYLGPFRSRKQAERCLAALHEAFPVRQCSGRLPAATDPARRACSPRWRAASRRATAASVTRALRRDGRRPARQPAAPRRRGGRGAHRADGSSGRPTSASRRRAGTGTGWRPSSVRPPAPNDSRR